MTITTPIEGVTAPRWPASPHAPAPITETFLPEDDTPYASRRADGWSAANQRLFLQAIAEGHGVEAATMRVGLSAASAYAFRRSAKGAAFALAWRAATLIAREAIAETLLVRALEGQVDTLTRPNGDIVTRHRHDNRLAMSLLARLDRQVEAAPDADVKAARLVAQEFDAFLDVLGQEASAARAGLFLARRAAPLADAEDTRDLAPLYALAAADRLVRTGVATAAEVPVADLDPAARAGWTAEQWARAEAAGLVTLAAEPAPPEPEPTRAPRPDLTTASTKSLLSQLSQHWQGKDDEEEEEDTGPVWWNDDLNCWCTRFPPPDDFDGWEEHLPGHPEYRRACTDHEAALMDAEMGHHSDAALAEQAIERDAFFADLAAAGAGTMVGVEEEEGHAILSALPDVAPEPAAARRSRPNPTLPIVVAPTIAAGAANRSPIFDPMPSPFEDDEDCDDDDEGYSVTALSVSPPSAASPGPL